MLAPVGWIWQFVYPAGLERLHNVAILYVLVPWIGVMAMGYAFGEVIIRKPEVAASGAYEQGLY